MARWSEMTQAERDAAHANEALQWADTLAKRSNPAVGHHEPVSRQERKQRAIAATYQPDPEMERLASIRDNDPARYEQMLWQNPDWAMSLGSYLHAKAVAQELGQA